MVLTTRVQTSSVCDVMFQFQIPEIIKNKYYQYDKDGFITIG